MPWTGKIMPVHCASRLHRNSSSWWANARPHVQYVVVMQVPWILVNVAPLMGIWTFHSRLCLRQRHLQVFLLTRAQTSGSPMDGQL